MSKAGHRDDPLYWERRLYRNTYTYRGERREVAAWHVKIQWRGERRTLRLQSGERRLAAEEALARYRELVGGGWSGLGAPGGIPGEGRERTPPPASLVVAPRKYVSELNPGFTREQFAEVTQSGVVERIALGTEDENEARLRALEVRAELLAQGWEAVRLRRAREVTAAVFWQADPMTCTYTTLLSVPATMGSRPPRPAEARGWRVLVIEPDAPVRRALLQWLSGSVGVGSVAGLASAEVSGELKADLLLVPQAMASPAVRALTNRVAARQGEVRLLRHGLYADSDAIFAAVSGVRRGYFLRRLPPGRLLEPLLAAFPEGPARGAEDEARRVRRYFQNAFEPESETDGLPAPQFTSREGEILAQLVRGRADKEIARDLGISVWTVHSHLRRIFAKYGVRTRTEVVVRHLQK